MFSSSVTNSYNHLAPRKEGSRGGQVARTPGGKGGNVYCVTSLRRFLKGRARGGQGVKLFKKLPEGKAQGRDFGNDIQNYEFNYDFEFDFDNETIRDYWRKKQLTNILTA